MPYQVYRITETGLPRDHEAIYVATSDTNTSTTSSSVPGENGHVYHVTGTIQTGMVFEHKPSGAPETSPLFAGKRHVGTVEAADYPGRFMAVCEGVPPPRKQFEGSRRLYPQERVRRCGEWAEEVVEALVKAEVLSV
ncbi:hypothetical protein PHISP_04726 [Aspergillus sp. HF37]|nr:hypothetical protein PHISP_04726 [Aspergillus sp. HF37]